eukprot:jgi/Botrbrau1/520/Bobra.110_2s0149.1
MKLIVLAAVFAAVLTSGSALGARRSLQQPRATGPGGNHAVPTNCPNDQVIFVNEGDTISQIAVGMGGNGCLSTGMYLTQLMFLNPQINSPNDALVPGDKICFPRQNGAFGRRRLLQEPRATGPGGNHADPPNCPSQQIGTAEAGDTLARIANVWKCQNPNANQNQADLVSRLMAVNLQINSPDLPLVAGDQICVAV